MNVYAVYIAKSARGREIARILKTRGHVASISSACGHYVCNVAQHLDYATRAEIAYAYDPERAATDLAHSESAARAFAENPRAWGWTRLNEAEVEREAERIAQNWC